MATTRRRLAGLAVMLTVTHAFAAVTTAPPAFAVNQIIIEVAQLFDSMTYVIHTELTLPDGSVVAKDTNAVIGAAKSINVQPDGSQPDVTVDSDILLSPKRLRLEITRTDAAPAAMPLMVEARYDPPNAGGALVAGLGYDTSTTTAPEFFRNEIRFAGGTEDTTFNFDITTTPAPATTALGLVGSIKGPRPDGVAVDQRGTLTLDPVPPTVRLDALLRQTSTTKLASGTLTLPAAPSFSAVLAHVDRRGDTERVTTVTVPQMPPAMTLTASRTGTKDTVVYSSPDRVPVVDAVSEELDGGVVTRRVTAAVANMPRTVTLELTGGSAERTVVVDASERADTLDFGVDELTGGVLSKRTDVTVTSPPRDITLTIAGSGGNRTVTADANARAAAVTFVSDEFNAAGLARRTSVTATDLPLQASAGIAASGADRFVNLRSSDRTGSVTLVSEEYGKSGPVRRTTATATDLPLTVDLAVTGPDTSRRVTATASDRVDDVTLLSEEFSAGQLARTTRLGVTNLPRQLTVARSTTGQRSTQPLIDRIAYDAGERAGSLRFVQTAPGPADRNLDVTVEDVTTAFDVTRNQPQADIPATPRDEREGSTVVASFGTRRADGSIEPGPVGLAQVGIGVGHAPSFPAPAEPAYAFLANGDLAARFPGFTSATVRTLPSFVKVVATTAPTRFRLDHLDDEGSSNAVFDVLPASVEVALDTEIGRLVYAGSAGIGTVTAHAERPEGFGDLKATVADMTVRGLPRAITLTANGGAGKLLEVATGAGQHVDSIDLKLRGPSGSSGDLLAPDEDGMVVRDLSATAFSAHARVTGLRKVSASRLSFTDAEFTHDTTRFKLTTDRGTADRPFRARAERKVGSKVEYAEVVLAPLPSFVDVSTTNITRKESGAPFGTTAAYAAHEPAASLRIETNAGERRFLRATLSGVPTSLDFCQATRTAFCTTGPIVTAGSSLRFRAGGPTALSFFDCRQGPASGCTAANAARSTVADATLTPASADAPVKVELDIDAPRIDRTDVGHVYADSDDARIDGTFRIKDVSTDPCTPGESSIQEGVLDAVSAEDRLVRLRVRHSGCQPVAITVPSHSGRMACGPDTKFDVNGFHKALGELKQELCTAGF